MEQRGFSQRARGAGYIHSERKLMCICRSLRFGAGYIHSERKLMCICRSLRFEELNEPERRGVDLSRMKNKPARETERRGVFWGGALIRRAAAVKRFRRVPPSYVGM